MRANKLHYGLRSLSELEGYTQIHLLFHYPIYYNIYF
jgi:hypothetical protein